MFGMIGSLGGAAISSIANIGMNAANNRQNMDITRENWARDDNAVQRRSADLQAAGINPLLAAGQAAGNSAPIPMKAGAVEDFGGAFVAGRQSDVAAKAAKNQDDVARGTLQNSTKVADAQVIKSLTDARLVEEQINAFKRDNRVADERGGFTREPASNADAWERTLNKYAPDLSALLKSALGTLSKNIAGGKPIFGGKPDIPKEKPRTREEWERGRYEEGLKGEPPKDWGDSDSYSSAPRSGGSH